MTFFFFFTDLYMQYLICLDLVFRFANSLPINDPLQTVYQLMSGRMPASATVNIASVTSYCFSTIILKKLHLQFFPLKLIDFFFCVHEVLRRGEVG